MIQIPLLAKDNKTVRGYAIVDASDDWLTERPWRLFMAAGMHRYAQRCSSGKNMLLHRLIAQDMAGRELLRTDVVDHIDGDGLNNRRSNLRITTTSGNLQNRIGPNARNKSGFRGVCWDKAQGAWHAQAFHMGKCYHAGRFDSVEEAAAAAAALRERLGFLGGRAVNAR